MKFLCILFTAIVLLTSCMNSEEEKKIAARVKRFNEMKIKFHEIKLPTGNPPQIYGFFSAGCLDGAVSLPISGIGYQVLRVSQRRYYGHPQLIKFIKDYAWNIHRAGLGNVLIGDMAMPRGGPMYYGHLSHQTGLDVDFAYKRIQDLDKYKMTVHEIDNMTDPSVMTADLTALNPSGWDDSNIKALRFAAEFKEVERIFVNPVIIKYICDKLKEENKEDEKWTKKIRPWYGHHDHYHVRLKCPPKNPQCIPQEVVTKGICSDAELEEWLTEEAMERQQEYFKNQLRRKEDVPELPETCQTVLDYKDL